MDLHQSIEQKIEKRENGCWEWTAFMVSNSPTVRFGDTSYSVRRFLVEDIYGRVRGHVEACEASGACVNPSHASFKLYDAAA